jgi:hypothetical protein
MFLEDPRCETGLGADPPLDRSAGDGPREREEDVLGPDERMVQAPRLEPGERQDLPSSLRVGHSAAGGPAYSRGRA